MPASFIFDLNRCTGCHACELACTIENELGFARSWRQVVTFNARHHPGTPQFHLSLACNHCAAAPCVTDCPARALRHDDTTGAVLLDAGRCVGCRYCLWVCPYSVPRFDDAGGVMAKCTFCQHRLSEGLEPACVALCPTGALGCELPAATELSTELSTESSAASSSVADETTRAVPGFPPADCRPAIRFIPLHHDRGVPECTAPAASSACPIAPARPRPEQGIALREEWTLATFTLLVPLLVAWQAAALLAPERVAVDPALFLGAAIGGLGLGGLHLGRKARAWRILLGVTRSWLSHEVVGFALFVGLAATSFLVAHPATLLGWTLPFGWASPLGWTPPAGLALPLGLAAAVVGAGTLFAVDRVYRFALGVGRGSRHSASTLLTGLLLAGCFAWQPLLSGVAAAIKLTLYVTRKLACARDGGKPRPVVSLLRILCGLLLPAILWLVDPPGARAGGMAGVLIGVLIGECIDRCEFYAELEPQSPGRRMDRDLAETLRRRHEAGTG